MNENINKYITIFKKNKKLLIPVVALLVVFLYNIVGGFFTSNIISGKKPTGTIQLQKEYVDESIKKEANYKITENNLQRELAASDEAEKRSDAMKNADKTYMRKDYLDNETSSKIDINDVGKLSFDKGFSNGEGICIDYLGKRVCLNATTCKQPEYFNLKECKEFNAKCRKDLVTNLVVCEELDGKKCFEKDGKKICLDETICKEFPYNTLQECKDLLRDLEAKKKEEEIKFQPQLRNVDNRGMKTNGNNDRNEVFGVSQGSIAYQKYSMLLGITTVDEKEVQGAVGNNYTSTKKEDTDLVQTSKKEDNKIYIKPGSSYLARLINPINTLYQGKIKPILDIIDGDLAGYRIIGEMSYEEAADGLVIAGTNIVSPDGTKEEIEAIAIRFEGEEMTPLFADSIDRHLAGKIGWGVLSSIAGDYGSMTSSNNDDENTQIKIGDTTRAKAGEQSSATFAQIAAGYKTEVKVNPQTMIVIFY